MIKTLTQEQKIKLNSITDKVILAMFVIFIIVTSTTWYALSHKHDRDITSIPIEKQVKYNALNKERIRLHNILFRIDNPFISSTVIYTKQEVRTMQDRRREVEHQMHIIYKEMDRYLWQEIWNFLF